MSCSYQWAAVAGGRGVTAGFLSIAGVTLDLGDARLAAIIGEEYPYEQWAGHFYQALSDERFVGLAVHALRLGLRIAAPIHNIDRALQLLERVNREVPLRERRCVEFHLMRADEGQLGRLRELGVAVTMIPTFLHLDARAGGLDELGERALPVRRVIDAGIPVAFGTDNRPGSMLLAMWAALARIDRASNRRLGDSHLTREEALRLSTGAGHYLTWQEERRGSITPGWTRTWWRCPTIRSRATLTGSRCSRLT